MTTAFRFVPFQFAWAALHPNPKGIIYFIGGAFFGSFPTIFYRFLLRQIFEQGYTIVALPYRFTFNHWSEAIALVDNQIRLREALRLTAEKKQYESALYAAVQANPSPPTPKEYWLGHSLGCKYIALLELLSDAEHLKAQNALDACVSPSEARQLLQQLDREDLDQLSLLNEPSILLDPVISDLDNAIPIPQLQKLFARFLKVLPSRQETFCLIQQSTLFSLTAIIAFGSQLASTTVPKLKKLLGDRLVDFKSLAVGNPLFGKHLAVLGWRRGNQEIVAAVLACLQQSRDKLANVSSQHD